MGSKKKANRTVGLFHLLRENMLWRASCSMLFAMIPEMRRPQKIRRQW